MLNLLVRRSLTAQEHDFHLQLHKWMRVVKAPIAQSFYSFRAPLQLEHLRTSWSKLILQLNFYQRFSKVSSCPARSIDGLLCMALQDAINRTQRGNWLTSLLCESLLNRCGTP